MAYLAQRRRWLADGAAASWLTDGGSRAALRLFSNGSSSFNRHSPFLVVITVAEVDDLTIRRFLRARDLDTGKASSMLLRYLKWRREFVPNGSVSPLETPNEVAQNKMFLQGSDARKGRPVTVILGARHVQSKGGLEEFKRFVVYGFDKICSRMPPAGQEKFVVIGDLEGWGYANSDIHGYLSCLKFLECRNITPERLAKVFLVHAPYVHSYGSF
nr:LOW QUALITY PROTEIN: phosphatidylinositol transfer protein 3-like [Populus alba]